MERKVENASEVHYLIVLWLVLQSAIQIPLRISQHLVLHFRFDWLFLSKLDNRDSPQEVRVPIAWDFLLRLSEERDRCLIFLSLQAL